MRTIVVLLLLALVRSAPAQVPACSFGPGALPAQTLPAGAPHGDQLPIDHIVVLMQENRSFDHYLGMLHRANRKIERLPRKASQPDPLGGKPIRPFRPKSYCEVADLDHSWTGTHREWDGGAMDGFTAENVDPADPSGSRTMHAYTKRDLPFYYKLYSTFAISDRYFCSLLGPTFPNRYYLLTGTSFGHIRNDFPTVAPGFTQKTIFELLDEAGVSWKVYHDGALAFAFIFAYPVTHDIDKIVGTDQYFADLQAGTLPQVAFIDPDFTLGNEIGDDEHPPANVQVGQEFTAKAVNALMASSAWARSVFLLMYDEHGGFWDHVPPPPACVPDDTPPMLEASDVGGAFDRYGIRVPFVAVSPYSKRHFVTHTVYDHTSILRFIETRFDLPALTRRDANADPMLELFDFAKPPFAKPPKLPKAVINPERAAQCDA